MPLPFCSVSTGLSGLATAVPQPKAVTSTMLFQSFFSLPLALILMYCAFVAANE